MDNAILDCIIVFFGGAIYEAGCVGWVHYSEKSQPIPTALFGILCATAQVAGIGESVHTHAAAPFFILGYGVGTYFAVWIKRKYLNV